MNFLQRFKNLFVKKPKKLGLALGSGGAKGFALIGAIKVFEEEGIEFDMAAGTSIGSIIGGLYCSGHTSDEMLALVREYDLTDYKTLIMMKLRGKTVESLLDDVLGGKTFEDLKKPFKAVAVDINSGEEVVISNGALARALAASAAIPPVFKPVGRENRKLIDGAFLNAVPADVVKEMGADAVISLSLSDGSGDTNESIKKTLDQLYKGNKVPLTDRLKKGRLNSDLWISPKTATYSAASLKNIEELYYEGYEATRAALPQIYALLKAKKFKRKI